MKKIVLLLMIAIMATSVYSLGIAPAKKTIDFAPGEKIIEYRIYNSDREDITVTVKLEGDIAEYAKETEITLDIKKEEQLKPFKIILNLPEKLEKDIDGNIVVTAKGKAGTVSANINLISKITVKTEVTGAAVNEPGQGSLMMGVLIALITLLVAGNIIYFFAGKIEPESVDELKEQEKSLLHEVETLHDLKTVISDVEEKEFSRMVQEKELYRYVRDDMNDPALASKIMNNTDRNAVVESIYKHIEELSSEEKEIEEEIIEKKLDETRDNFK